MLFLLRVPNSLCGLAVLFLSTISLSAVAMDLRLGASLGYGGSGISGNATINSTAVPVDRSESPGMLGVSIETILSDKSTLAIDHTRGFSLGPFSMGVGFTGFTWRRYFSGTVPSMVDSPTESTILIKRYIPFLGLEAGVAQGTIFRSGDLVPSITGSGVFYAFRLGVDYQMEPRFIVRTEILSGTTFATSGFDQSKLTEFSFQSGLVYIF